MSSRDVDFRELGKGVLLEFLEVAIHTLLYTRQLYDARAFKQCKKYNVPVYMCNNPEVNEYVGNIVKSIKPLLDDRSLEYVAFVVLLEESLEPIERFVFDFALSNDGQGDADDFLIKLEQSLRSTLLKLATADSVLKAKPENCTWTVHAKTTDIAVEDMQSKACIEDFQWINVEVKEPLVENAQLIPIRTMDTHTMKMQLYVEERG